MFIINKIHLIHCSGLNGCGVYCVSRMGVQTSRVQISLGPKITGIERMHFFLGVFSNLCVHTHKPRTLMDLKNAINQEVFTNNGSCETLGRVVDKFKK